MPFRACFLPFPFIRCQFYWQSIASLWQTREKGWYTFEKTRNRLRTALFIVQSKEYFPAKHGLILFFQLLPKILQNYKTFASGWTAGTLSIPPLKKEYLPEKIICYFTFYSTKPPE